MSTTTTTADARFLRVALALLIAATIASGAMLAYAAASMV
jgi:hypothetical protein